MGYHRAGFEVVGVDIKPQPHYPFEFHRMDALRVLSGDRDWPDGGGGVDPDGYSAWSEEWRGVELDRFDAIHASPPCQGYSNLRKGEHPRLIAPVRELLRAAGLPYVIENIADAAPHMKSPVRLCGSALGLNVRRHRLFECSFPVMATPCAHGGQAEIRAYYGKRGWLVWTPAAANVQKAGRKPLLRGSVDQAPEDMGIGWMTWDELREAIPPAYTQHIGEYLLLEVARRAEVAA